MSQTARLRIVGPCDAPPPPLPVDIDLRDYPNVMINRDWVRHSRFARTASFEERCAAIELQAACYDESPSASLPSDDVDLAHLAGYGRDISGWLKVKDRALEGWLLHSDGRLYHREIAIQGLQAWLKRLKKRKGQAASVASRRKLPADLTRFDKSTADAVAALTALDPQNPNLDGYRQAEPQVGAANCTANDFRNEKLSEAKPSLDSERSSEPARANSPPDQEIENKGSCPLITKCDEWGKGSFQVFWAKWPGERVNRAKAELAFKRAAREHRVAFAEVLAGLERYRLGKPPDRPWRNPATWLNGRGWEDEWPTQRANDPPVPTLIATRPTSGIASAMAGITAVFQRRQGNDDGFDT